jgi:drug/metabolite transporter (DMT)-like permease
MSTVPKVFGLFSFGVIVLALAELFIALSITNKSAALAGLIEISYPVFIALFSYLLFKESDLNVPIAIGGLLIFSGVAVVYWFSD